MRHNDAAQHFRFIHSFSTRIGEWVAETKTKKRRLMAPLSDPGLGRNLPDKLYEPLPADASDR